MSATVARTTTLRGRTIDELGSAVAGSHVVVSVGAESHHANADASGRFELPVPAEAPFTAMLVASSHGGLARRTIEATRGGVHDLGDVILAPSGSLAGTVRGAAGEPLPGSLLLVVDVPRNALSEALGPLASPSVIGGRGAPRLEARAVADAEGRYEIEVDEGVHVLWASAPGHRWARLDTPPVRRGATTALDVRLEAADPADSTSGIVVDSDESPVAGALVHAVELPEVPAEAVARTDAAGRFDLAVPLGFAGRPMRIVAADASGCRTGSVVTSVGARDVVVRVTRPPFQTVHVVDAVSRAPLRAKVSTTAALLEDFACFRAETSGRGEGARLPCPDVPAWIRAEADGYRTGFLGPLACAPAGSAVTIALQRAVEIRGSVVHDGRPAPGVVVQAHVAHAQVAAPSAIDEDGWPMAGSSIGSAITTDAEGRFRIFVDAPGPVLLGARRDDLAALVAAHAPASELEIPLADGAVLEVRTSWTGHGAAVDVPVALDDGFGDRSFRTCRVGEAVRFAGLHEGPWRVAIGRPGAIEAAGGRIPRTMSAYEQVRQVTLERGRGASIAFALQPLDAGWLDGSIAIRGSDAPTGLATLHDPDDGRRLREAPIVASRFRIRGSWPAEYEVRLRIAFPGARAAWTIRDRVRLEGPPRRRAYEFTLGRWEGKGLGGRPATLTSRFENGVVVSTRAKAGADGDLVFEAAPAGPALLDLGDGSAPTEVSVAPSPLGTTSGP